MSTAVHRLDGSPKQVAERVRTRQLEMMEIAKESVRRHSMWGKQDWFVNSVASAGYRADWTETAISFALDLDVQRYRDVRLASPVQYHMALALCALDVSPTKTINLAAAVHARTQPLTHGGLLDRDILLATHLVRGDSRTQVEEEQNRIAAVFAEDRDTKKFRNQAAKLCTAFKAEPEDIIQRFKHLSSVRKESKTLRKLPEQMLMNWTALDLSEADLEALEAMYDPIKSETGLDKGSAFRMARLIQLMSSETANKNALHFELFNLPFRPPTDAGGGSHGGDGGGGDGGGG